MKFQHAILIASMALASSGCGAPYPVMRQIVSLDYNPGSRPPLAAKGYLATGDSNADAVMTELSMWLAPAARPFILVFPDGYRMGVSNVSKRQILDHGPSLGTLRVREASGKTSLLFTSSEGGQFEFVLHADDLVHLRICTDFSKPIGKGTLSFETPGGQVLSWPVRQSELLRLFGEPFNVRYDFVLARWPC